MSLATFEIKNREIILLYFFIQTSDSTNGHFQRCYTALQKRSADYEKQRLQLAQNIAYRYPNPGMPRYVNQTRPKNYLIIVIYILSM